MLTIPVQRLCSVNSRLYAAAVALLCLVPATHAVAQRASAVTGSSIDTTQHHAAPVPLITGRDAAIGAGVVAIVFAVMPADRSIANAFQRPGVQTNGALRGGANVFNAVGFPGAAAYSAGAYFLGLGMHSRPIAALGMHTGEAIVLAGVLDEVLKGTIGRARPIVDIRNSHDYHPGKGFSNDDYASLPSGHVTLAFAAAAMTSREVSRSWPDAARYVTPLSYGTASLVAAARMYKNEHWASDVVGGAALGTFAAVMFDRYNRGHPNNVFDRVFLPASVVPVRDGVAIAWVLPAQW